MAEINREELLNCALCPNMCRCECPVVQAAGREAVAPSGKARLAAMLNDQRLPWQEDYLDALSGCLGCSGCTIHCPFDELSLCDELRLSRLAAKSSDVALPERVPYLNNLRNYGSPYGRKPDNSYKKGGRGDVLFFSGCTSLTNHARSIDAALALLDTAGIEWQMIEEDCCGFPAEVWGDLGLARQLAEENRRKIAESGASALVTNCPECWLVFSDRYPDWGLELDLEIIDGPTYFLNLIRDGRLQPGETGFKTVTYHDPCIWARTAKKTGEPREILQKIPGLILEEAYRHSELTRCCGGGNMFQLAFPAKAAAIADKRLAEMPGDAQIVTACPFCREGLNREGRQVYELVELLAKACRH